MLVKDLFIVQSISENIHYNEDKWELYYMIDDSSETNDLSEKYPEKVEELLTAYQQILFYNQ